MAEGEEDPRGPKGQRRDAEIAAAEWLFQDDETVRSAQPQPAASPRAATDPGEVFDLIEGPGSDPSLPTDAIPVPRAAPVVGPTIASPRPAGDGDGAPGLDPQVLVEEVWSRPAEWGPTLLILAALVCFLAILLYFTWGQELYSLGFFILLGGAALAIVLSYPILITLERPVRMTPEQAVRDFYGALSHHFPHYRRMWLLLSTAGRTTAHYGSFEGFKSYWVERLRTLKGDQAGSITPLAFEVVDYRGDRSAGKSHVDVAFTLRIYIRGRRSAGPIASLPALLSLVRGPDRMWYLDSGTLPHATRAHDRAESPTA